MSWDVSAKLRRYWMPTILDCRATHHVSISRCSHHLRVIIDMSPHIQSRKNMSAKLFGSNHYGVILNLQWPNHGGGIKNWRAAIGECKISSDAAPKLNKKWTVSTSGDITATPAIANGVVYFPTWNGEVFAVDEKNGTTIWRKNLTQLIGSPTIHVSRHTPVVDGEYLLVGLYIPAQLLALHRSSGNLVWSNVLDADPNACITMSGTTYERYGIVIMALIVWSLLIDGHLEKKRKEKLTYVSLH